MLTRSWMSTYIRPFSWLVAIIILCVWRRFSCQGTTLILFNLPSKNIRSLLVKYRNWPLQFSKLLGMISADIIRKELLLDALEHGEVWVALPAVIWCCYFGLFVLLLSSGSVMGRWAEGVAKGFHDSFAVIGILLPQTCTFLALLSVAHK